MSKNRYLPYGYVIQNGRVVPQETEADVVRRVFAEYAAGASYLTIAQRLTADGIPYTPDKPVWNKNMIARMLQNKVYLGEDNRPSLVSEEAFMAARDAQKPYTHTVPRELKQLKRLLVCGICGKPLGRRLQADGRERWYCEGDYTHIPVSLTDETLLARLRQLSARLPEYTDKLAVTENKAGEAVFRIARLQNELNALLDCEIEDETHARELILQLAAEKYKACDHTAQTADLQSRLVEAAAGNTAVFLKLASEIQITAEVVVSLKLHNGNIICEGESSHAEVR